MNKIVGFLVSPIGGVIAGVAVVLVCRRLKWMRFAKWVGVITGVWLWLWSTPVMTRVVGAPLESEFLVDGRVPLAESFSTADVIVLLGGAMGTDTNLSVYAEMCTSADRVWQAARLWKAGKAPRIIATGDGARESTLGLLKDLGVDEKCIEFLDARNTEEEAKVVGCQVLGAGSQELVARREYQTLNSELKTEKPKVLLVTSAWHMKRARMMFEKYARGVEVVCAPSDFECMMAAKRGWAVLPEANVFNLNSVAFHEWVGIIGYLLFR